MQARLLESTEMAPDVRHFLFDVPEVPALEFTPGQFVSFRGEVRGKAVTRAYSLASGPDGNRFELCLNRVKEGLFSPFLFELEPGQQVEMRGPLGYFVPRRPLRDSVLVATGTGVAPFRSFLRSREVLESAAPLTLLFGARYESGLLFGCEFEELASVRPGFRYLPTLTRPEPGWQGRAGRVQQHLDEALAGRGDVDVYVCGLKAMVEEVRQLLKDKGFDRKQIIAEKYD